MENAARMKALFNGLERAYGTYKITGSKNNKQIGEALTIVSPVTSELWKEHLNGIQGIGIVPIKDDSTCLFGAIDIDVYTGIDYRKILQSVLALKYPLVPCKSKSGGLHLYLFSNKPVPAADMRDKLSSIAASIGFGGVEIFPKQSRILAERGDIGGWINMPYFNAKDTNRPGLNDQAEPMDFPDFLKAAEEKRCDIYAIQTEGQSLGDLSDGPPCLQHILSQGVAEGTRNEVAFNLATYLKQAKPDDWKNSLEEMIAKYFTPPLDKQEIKVIVKSVQRREYLYGCSKAPLKTYCDKGSCRLRKFGIGQGGDFPLLTGLTKFDTTPPTWFLDVDGGGRIELTTDDLQVQLRFQRKCMDYLNKMPPMIKPEQWRTMIHTLLENVVVVQAPHDSSTTGQLLDLLENFCTSRAQAKTIEEILIGKPWLNEGKHYFRMSDFMAYLDRQRFREFKVHKVAQIIRDRGARNVFLHIKKKGVNLWAIDEFSRAENTELPLPDLGEGSPI